MCLLPMIHGCGPNGPIRLDAPLALDLASVRCPEIDEGAKREAKRVTPRPAGPVTKDQTRQWINSLELSEVRKNRTLQRVIDEYERCRTGKT